MKKIWALRKIHVVLWKKISQDWPLMRKNISDTSDDSSNDPDINDADLHLINFPGTGTPGTYFGESSYNLYICLIIV